MENLKRHFVYFAKRQDGAVTVDWVVLTAVVIALGITAAASVTTGATDLSDNIWTYMDSLDLFN